MARKSILVVDDEKNQREILETILSGEGYDVTTASSGEPCVAEAENGKVFQFLRTGYFCKDPDSTAEKPVYNRTVSLKDSWAKAKDK